MNLDEVISCINSDAPEDLEDKRSTRMEGISLLPPLRLLSFSHAQGARRYFRVISQMGDMARGPELKQLSCPDSPPQCSTAARLTSHLLQAQHPARQQVKQKRNGLTSQQRRREGNSRQCCWAPHFTGKAQTSAEGRLRRAVLKPLEIAGS